MEELGAKRSEFHKISSYFRVRLKIGINRQPLLPFLKNGKLIVFVTHYLPNSIVVAVVA